MNPLTKRSTSAFGLVMSLALTAPAALAQLSSSGSATQGSLANQLPLRGTDAQGGSVTATQAPIAGTTTSVNTLNTSVQASGPYAGSIRSTAKTPFTGTLSFLDAVQRGLDFNLGAEGMAQAMRQAQGQAKVARSALLPNITADASETIQQTNLKVAGIRLNTNIAGLSIPSIVGPYNYFDLRAHLTQTIGDMTAWKNYRSAQELARSQQYALKDARDMVVLAVGGSYLQVVAAKARLTSAQAQLTTATALYRQATDQRTAGVLSLTDLNKSHIEVLTDQQRLESLRNDLAKQKINLARMTGLPPNDEFEISDDIPFAAGPDINLQDALAQAYLSRQDLKVSASQLRASELAKSAARAERLPSLAVSGDYGVNGINPDQSHRTFSGTATLSIPVWRGGRTEGDIQQADATFVQRRSELDNLHDKIESDIRSAFLDLQTTMKQVAVAEENLKVNQQTLELTRQRYEAGVTDNVEVVQAQEAVANAELDRIDSVFANNIAKLNLARAMGNTETRLTLLLKLP
ncbi:MAG: TolC family protein [Acidobacteriaceae bacterium]|nr:TolC family protein [Acidobacteriaceae bacterium]